MAGSLTYRRYTADDGTDYTIKIDESNAQSTVEGTNVALVPQREGNYPPCPRGLTLRYVLAFQQDRPEVKKKFVVGGVASISRIFQPGAIINSNGPRADDDTPGAPVNFVITSYRGEKVNFVPAFNAPDTGLLDGDTSS